MLFVEIFLQFVENIFFRITIVINSLVIFFNSLILKYKIELILKICN
jgi:hypothetical protein